MESDYHTHRHSQQTLIDWLPSAVVGILPGGSQRDLSLIVSPGHHSLSFHQSSQAGKSQKHCRLPINASWSTRAILELEKPCQVGSDYGQLGRENLPSFFASMQAGGHNLAIELKNIDEDMKNRGDASYFFLTPKVLGKFVNIKSSLIELNDANESCYIDHNQFIRYATNNLEEVTVFQTEDEHPSSVFKDINIHSFLNTSSISDRKYLKENNHPSEIRSVVETKLEDFSTSLGVESQGPPNRIIGLSENEKLDLVELDEWIFFNGSRVIEPSSEGLLERNPTNGKMEVGDILADGGGFCHERADRIEPQVQNSAVGPLPSMIYKTQTNEISSTPTSNRPSTGQRSSQPPSPLQQRALLQRALQQRALQMQKQYSNVSSLPYSLTKRKAPTNLKGKVRVLHFKDQKNIFSLKQFWMLSLPLLLLSALPFSAGEANPEAYPGPDPGPAKQWKAIGDVIPETDYEDSYTENKPKCDRQYISGSQKEGVFRAPDLYNPDQISRQCLYTFIAGEGERVQLQFRRFDLRGTPPEV